MSVPAASASGKCPVLGLSVLSRWRPPKSTTSVTDRSLPGWSQPSPGEWIAGIGYVGCPCHVLARGRDRDHRSEKGMVEVLHLHWVPEAGRVHPSEADQYRQAASGQTEVGTALDPVGALRYLPGGEPEMRGPCFLWFPRGEEPGSGGGDCS
jgi:hypothetical protein